MVVVLLVKEQLLEFVWSSLSANNDPLYVIDGVPVAGVLMEETH
jgi:hypothetical protein